MNFSAEDSSNKASVDILFSFWKEHSLQLFQSHSKLDHLSIEQYEPKTPIHGHWLSFNCLVVECFRIYIKIYYFSKDGAFFSSKAFQKKPAEISSAQHSDFTKEFCNLFSGRLKYFFEKNNIGNNCSISLPVTIRSFDNLYFTKNSINLSYDCFWKIKKDEFYLISNISLDITDPNKFRKFEFEYDNVLTESKLEIL